MDDNKTTVINSIVGTGTTYKGNIESVDLLRIDGNFIGTAKSQDVILVGEQGRMKADLYAPRVIIAGVFQGNIYDCDLVILQSTAVVIGNLNIKNIIVEPGAIIRGSLISNNNKTIFDKKEDVSHTPINVRNSGVFSRKMLEKLFNR